MVPRFQDAAACRCAEDGLIRQFEAFRLPRVWLLLTRDRVPLEMMSALV
jgi:hypothetical protein